MSCCKWAYRFRYGFLLLEDKNFVLTQFSHMTGKTLLAKTLAKVLDVPFSVSDATSFTQVGIFHLTLRCGGKY